MVYSFQMPSSKSPTSTLFKLLAFLLGLVLLSGCSTKGVGAYKHKISLTKYPKQEKKTYTPKNNNAVVDALYEEYMKWEGTSYCYGGTSKRGVDCSSFVQQVYFAALNLRVPRTTKEQAKQGRWVKKSELRSGDLMLFKTGYDKRHSGIYLEHGKFMQVSAKYGVTLSSINNPYWKAKYWQSRRIFEY